MKSLDELFNEYVEANNYNKILLQKCKNHEPPFAGEDEDGRPLGGETSKAYLNLYSMITSMERAIADLSRLKAEKLPSTNYQNVIKYEPIHRCWSCRYCSKIDKENVCKNPKLTINHVEGVLTSNCLTKFDSFKHFWLKICPEQIGCRNWREIEKEYSSANQTASKVGVMTIAESIKNLEQYFELEEENA